MKKLLLFLSFLLFNSFLSFAAAESDLVLDIEGEEVRTGVEYYVVSAIWGAGGGGINFGPNPGNETCPLAVIQERSDLNRGHPVTFTPVNTEEGVVRVSTDLNIQFSKAITICSESNVWKISYDEENGQSFILTDGVEGNPACGTLANWFQIENLGSFAYKLVFCPTVCNDVKVTCRDVGIVSVNGYRYLALSDTPFMAVFIKASSMKIKIFSSPLPLVLDVLSKHNKEACMVYFSVE